MRFINSENWEKEVSTVETRGGRRERRQRGSHGGGDRDDENGRERTHLGRIGRIHVIGLLWSELLLHLLHLPYPGLVDGGLRHVWMGLLELLTLALTLLLLLLVLLLLLLLVLLLLLLLVLLLLLLLLLLKQGIVEHWVLRGHAICHERRRCGGRKGGALTLGEGCGEREGSGGGSEARLAGCG